MRRVCVAAVVLVALGAAGPATAGDWPQLRADAANSGVNATESAISAANASSLAVRWHGVVAGGAGVWSGVSIANGHVVVGGWDHVAGLDPASGAELWAAWPAKNGLVEDAVPTIVGNTAYVGWRSAGVGSIAAIDATSGAILWDTHLDGVNVYSSPVYANGLVYIDTDGGTLWALDGTTGAVVWSQPSYSDYSTPAVVGGRIYLDGRSQSAGLSVRDASTGALEWEYAAAGDYVPGAVAVAGGTLYAAFHSGTIAAYPAAGCGAAVCQPLWSKTIGDPTTSPIADAPSVAGSALYVAAGNRLFALDASSGVVLWTGAVDAQVYGSPAVANGVAYVDTRGGSVFAFAAGGCGTATCAPLWSDTVGDPWNSFLTGPAIANGVVYAVTYDGDVWAFSLPGVPTTVPPDTRITSASTGTDGNATISFDATESGSTFECALNGAAWQSCSSPQTYVDLPPGSYMFAVRATGPGGGTDATPDTVSWTVPVATAPANDDFANAQTLTADTAVAGLSTVAATKEAGEPAHAGNTGGHSVWFRWTAPAGGTVTMDTEQSDFDTLLAVYTGSSLSSLNQIAANDDATTSDRLSKVTFAAIAGVTYLVAVDGRNGVYGNGELNIAAPTAPPADASPNLLSNGSFEGDLAGWAGNGATLSLAGDGAVGAEAAKVGVTSSTPLMYASPRPVTSTSAGSVYTYGGWLRSATPGRTVCLRLREYSSSGTLLGANESCTTATSAWAQFPTLSYTAKGNGSSLAVHVYEQNAVNGDSFEADGLTLTASASAPADTTPPDTTITSGASGTVDSTSASFSFSSSESGSTFQCQLDGGAWTACTSPQSYASLASGGHTFAVRATDAAGNTDPTPASATWTVQTAPTNLLANGSFEGTTSGWAASNGGTLSLTSGGETGAQAARIATGSGSTPMLYASPRPVSSTTAGAVYTLQAWIRSTTPGLHVCERIREWSSSGTLLSDQIECLTATSSWQQAAAASITAQASGSTIAIQVYATTAVAGQTFDVDGVTLTRSQR